MTINYNLVIGAAAWTGSATNYSTLGEVRLNDGGKAYRVITTGVGAGAGGPTGTGSSITDGTVQWKYLCTPDYTDFATAEAALPGTFTDLIYWKIWNTGVALQYSGAGYEASASIYISGHVTTSAFYLHVTAAAGESICDQPAGTPIFYADASKGVMLESLDTGGFSHFLYSDDTWIKFSRLQFKKGQSGGWSDLLRYSGNTGVSGSVGFMLEKCLIDCNSDVPDGNAPGVINAGASNGSGSIGIGNIIIDRSTDTGGSTEVCVYTGNNNIGTFWVNNLYYAPNGGLTTTQAFSNSFAVWQAYNNIVFGAGVPFYTGFLQVDSQNNLTDVSAFDASVTDSGSIFNSSPSAQFSNVSSDVNPKSGAAGSVGGMDASAYLTTDFFGTALSAPYPIGPLKLVTASGRLLVRQNMTGGMNQEFTGGMGA